MDDVGNLIGGRVRIRSLPTSTSYSGKPENEMRLLTPRGELAVIRNSEEPIRYIAYVEFPAGAVRGGHYHGEREENLYMIRGRAELTVEDTVSRERHSLVIQAGDLVIIEPGVAHTVKALESGHGVEFSATPRRPDDSSEYRHSHGNGSGEVD